jgi:hypothetical protein
MLRMLGLVEDDPSSSLAAWVSEYEIPAQPNFTASSENIHRRLSLSRASGVREFDGMRQVMRKQRDEPTPGVLRLDGDVEMLGSSRESV